MIDKLRWGTLVIGVFEIFAVSPLTQFDVDIEYIISLYANLLCSIILIIGALVVCSSSFVLLNILC